MSWYCMYGNPRWDNDELWTTMGHLYKGGMWFKKKSVLIAEGHYSTEKSADNTTDMRTSYVSYNNNNSSINSSGVLSAFEANNYFYLPCLGYYHVGLLANFPRKCGYWSSDADPSNSLDAYGLFFASNFVAAGSYGRNEGFRVAAFE